MTAGDATAGALADSNLFAWIRLKLENAEMGET